MRLYFFTYKKMLTDLAACGRCEGVRTLSVGDSHGESAYMYKPYVATNIKFSLFYNLRVITSVSYTHLDVYKRQDVDTAAPN